MVTVGPKPHQEAAHGPGPSLGRVGDGAQQLPAGAEVVHLSGPLAGMCRGFRVSRRVASRRPVSTALGCQAMGCGVDQASPQLLRIAQSTMPAGQPLNQVRRSRAAAVEAERPVVAMLISVFRVT
jgi:hypothetical protein